MSEASCCAPSAAGGAADVAAAPAAWTRETASTEGMVRVPHGKFLMGNDSALSYPADGEGPVREITLTAFWIDSCAVSNAAFGRFVDGTGYRTQAERFGWSFVFGGLLPDEFPPTRGVAEAPWWRQVYGADWRHPEGPQSTVDDRGSHPVIHVTWQDAKAYAGWAGKRLPTEAEWECAARGGRSSKLFPWGDELTPGGVHRMNVWQGSFPQQNTLDDGWYGTCPVDAFEPNDLGLHNVTGNVWEWCADWFHPTFHTGDTKTDPQGPADGTRRVTKGGSYLCHASYCHRYRVAARQGLTPGSSTGNVGFRCALDIGSAE